MQNKKLSFLVYGAGVIGSIFAGKLAGAGYDVTVLARNNRLDEIMKNGLILRESLSGKKYTYNVKTTDTLKPEDIYDFILVVMQNTQVDDVLPILARNRTQNIVFVVNNPTGYDKYIKYVGKDRIIIGFPSGGGERKNGEVDYFIGKGLSKVFQSTTFGELDGSKTERLKKLVKAFKEAGFSPATNHNMAAWQKTHVAVVLPIGNAIYKHDGDNYQLGKSTRDIKLMITATREAFEVLKKTGNPVTPGKLNFYYLPCFILVTVFRILMGTKIAEVAMAKHAKIARAEMIELQNEFKQIIKESGLKTPAFDELAKYNK